MDVLIAAWEIHRGITRVYSCLAERVYIKAYKFIVPNDKVIQYYINDVVSSYVLSIFSK